MIRFFPKINGLEGKGRNKPQLILCGQHYYDNKTGKDSARKENQIILMKIDTKIPNKLYQTEPSNM